MRIRLLALAACLCAAAPHLRAEASVFASPLTPAARPVLARVCGRISRDPVVAGGFTQVKHLKRLSKDFTSRGRFLFAVDKGILWEVLTPFASTTVITRERLVQRTPAGKTSTLEGGANPVFRRFADTLQAVFSGKLEHIEGEFDLFFDPRGETSWRLGLVPRDPTLKGVIASMEISGSEHLREVLLTEAGGDTVRYTFTDARSREALTADEDRLFF
jgi:hypothetical protein